MGTPIRVSLVRIAGIGGARRAAFLDTESLDEERASKLRRLVEEADIARVSEPTIRSTRDKERFHFTLTVHHGSFQHTLTFAEDKTPEQLQPLVEMVWQEGQPGPDDTQGV